MREVDLRSDTVTRPTAKMREVMAKAKVGDDVYREDPTVNKLEEKAAQALGKEAALFVPSGTMGNLLAVMTHTQPGDEIILGENSHIFCYEVGGLAKLAGVQAKTLADSSGIFSPKAMQEAIRDDNIHYPRTGLICVENTHNRAGGVAVSKVKLDDICNLAIKNNLPVHLDGARLFNAAAELEIDVKSLVKNVDSVMFCISKGLAAPVGSLLVGSKEFIMQARKNRKMLGGGMRQAGMLAAAGLVALEEMTNRIDDDHNLANKFAKLVKGLDSEMIRVRNVNTNFVILEVTDDIKGLITQLADRGVKISQFGPGLLRAVIHKDISNEDINYVVNQLVDVEGKFNE
ncbi:threonine aldolase [Halobacteroides halobius DSM 5150]|uniref:Threonine aldolase n=1 Tax=Halobacteroides halobius (strain ATCC 35273 / DSM 5150 / MD-1) TaxID=748449 RepID=L0K8N9_HALHC|nr:GntG family PLP-dependent aldolase [Halobacteroides halobius]AGB40488.1 threonine aldolase [Halobacteroides halobius DSM 5150]